MHKTFINGTKYIFKILFPVKWMCWKSWVHELNQQILILCSNFQDHAKINFIATNISWNKFYWFFFGPNREIIYQVTVFIFATLFQWLLYFSDELNELIKTSCFWGCGCIFESHGEAPPFQPEWIGDLQLQICNILTDFVERICLVVCLQRLSFDTIFYTVPPLPSHGCLQWLV